MHHLKEISVAVQGQVLQMPDPTQDIEHLLTDSRKIIFPESALFVAIKGVNHDAHLFLKDVYQAGVRSFLVEPNRATASFLESMPDANFIEVANGLDALQSLAAWHRSAFHFPIIAITGSNGKTVVKEWLYQLLKDDVHIVRSPKSYNSQVGVPLSVWQIKPFHELGIFEAGISEPGEMQHLAQIIHPTVGIFTWLGEAHQQGFRNKEEKLQEKFILFKDCDIVICPIDQELVKAFISTQPNPNKFFTWSLSDPKANCFFEIEQLADQSIISWNSTNVTIPFTDDASIWNACTCLAYLIQSNRFNTEKITERFAALTSLDMRLQLEFAANNCLLINDSYSADIDSLQIALAFQDRHEAGYQKTVILSDILESGRSPEMLYKTVNQLLVQHKIDQLIGIGNSIQQCAHLFEIPATFYPSTLSFLSQVLHTHFKDEIILLKGARSYGFEQIGKWFQKQIHQTVFEVNLNALVNNLNCYKTLLQPEVKIMAMVKAFSYGSGSHEIASVLAFHRVDYLTVAYADEGVALRKAGIRTPIMVMNPEPSAFDVLLQYHLEPEMYQFELLEAYAAFCKGMEAGIHIELDTGMKRLGFDTADIPRLITFIARNSHLQIRSLFTHLAASEAHEHDGFTRKQIETFKAAASQLSAALPYKVLLHCLNSGGIVRFPDAQFDMVRLGIGLYGIDPGNVLQNDLQPIGRLKTVISQVRKLTAGESVGYGRKGHVEQDATIAIVAIGYADGLNRKLSNGVGAMCVNGKLAKIIGNICMDMTMLDVTGISCKVGDEVIVFGENPTIHEVSDLLGTIPYELLTGISQRVKRVYYFE